MNPETMSHQERLQFINSLRIRVEQTYGRTPEELADLAGRGILPPSDEELELGIRALRLVRLGATAKKSFVAIDEF